MVVTVVTPTLDAAAYIAQTIASVRAQTYADIEHIIVDGGSRDETQAIVATSPNARFVSAPGLRQAAAVNRGVAEARGKIIVVLNADDTLTPGAIATLVSAMERVPLAVAAYGDAVHIDDAGRILSTYPTLGFDRDALMEGCYICQPASAVRRSAFLAIGGMDPLLDVALDYDFWIRLAKAGEFVRVDGVLAASRMHDSNKTLSRRGDMYREVMRVLRTHFDYVPYTWIYGYANWLIDRRDQFFAAPRRTKASVALALPLGLSVNVRHPMRFLRDWYEHRGRSIGR